MMNLYMAQQNMIEHSINQMELNPAFSSEMQERNVLSQFNDLIPSRRMEVEKPIPSESKKEGKTEKCTLKIQDVEEILQNIIKNLQKEPKNWLRDLKEEYKGNSDAMELIKVLLHRFDVQKTREEVIKFTMRVLFKKLQGNLYSGRLSHLPQKHFVRAFIIFYFKDFLMSGDSEFSLQNLDLLPFRKGSKIKTMNRDFMNKIMSSELFRNEFFEFTNNFDQVFQKINKKKITKTVIKVFRCVQDRDFKKIEKMRGFPWLDKWLETSKEINLQIVDFYEKIYTVDKREGKCKDDLDIKRNKPFLLKRSKSIH